MTIQAVCTKCGKEYRVKDDMHGKKIRCKLCQAVVLVEASSDDDFGDLPLQPVTKKKGKKRKMPSFQMPSGLMILGLLGLLIPIGFFIARIAIPELAKEIGLTIIITGIAIAGASHYMVGIKNEGLLRILGALIPIFGLVPIVRNFRENWPYLAAMIYGIALVFFAICLKSMG